jgi:hypothetical protein
MRTFSKHLGVLVISLSLPLVSQVTLADQALQIQMTIEISRMNSLDKLRRIYRLH